jgi:hypothetical protein
MGGKTEGRGGARGGPSCGVQTPERERGLLHTRRFLCVAPQSGPQQRSWNGRRRRGGREGWAEALDGRRAASYSSTVQDSDLDQTPIARQVGDGSSGLPRLAGPSSNAPQGSSTITVHTSMCMKERDLLGEDGKCEVTAVIHANAQPSTACERRRLFDALQNEASAERQRCFAG